MAHKIKSSGGKTASNSMMPGRYAPGFTTPAQSDVVPMNRMTKSEARRERKLAKADHKAAFDAGQMKTANELSKRMKQLKAYS